MFQKAADIHVIVTCKNLKGMRTMLCEYIHSQCDNYFWSFKDTMNAL